MVDIVNMVGGNTHLHMLLFLEVANRDPSGNLVECADGADVAEDESHQTTNKVAILPAGGLEGGPEVAAQTTLTRLTVVQEKAVSATHPIVVEVVDDRHLEIEGGLINRGRETGKDIVDLPKIKATDFLIFTKPLGDGQVVESVKGGTDFGLNVRAQKFFG